MNNIIIGKPSKRPRDINIEVAEIAGSLTIAEVVEQFGIHHKTVMQSINNNRLTCRKAGKVWVISKSSARHLWGATDDELFEQRQAKGE